MKKLRFSANISLYLRNNTRYGHRFYGMRIVNFIQAFEWYHFQWPGVTRNPDFKVTPVFDAEYLRNGNTIGTCTCPTQRCHFEWSWVTLSELVKYLMTRNIARSFCDRRASCLPLLHIVNPRKPPRIFSRYFELKTQISAPLHGI